MSRKNQEMKQAKNRIHRPLRNQDIKRMENGVSIPVGAIPADLSAQKENNSYSPPLYYEDREITCVDCGKREIWTAEQQHWWYEVAKGSIYATAVRCRRCRGLDPKE